MPQNFIEYIKPVEEGLWVLGFFHFTLNEKSSFKRVLLHLCRLIIFLLYNIGLWGKTYRIFFKFLIKNDIKYVKNGALGIMLLCYVKYWSDLLWNLVQRKKFKSVLEKLDEISNKINGQPNFNNKIMRGLIYLVTFTLLGCLITEDFLIQEIKKNFKLTLGYTNEVFRIIFINIGNFFILRTAKQLYMKLNKKMYGLTGKNLLVMDYLKVNYPKSIKQLSYKNVEPINYIKLFDKAKQNCTEQINTTEPKKPRRSICTELFNFKKVNNTKQKLMYKNNTRDFYLNTDVKVIMKEIKELIDTHRKLTKLCIKFNKVLSLPISSSIGILFLLTVICSYYMIEIVYNAVENKKIQPVMYVCFYWEAMVVIQLLFITYSWDSVGKEAANTGIILHEIINTYGGNNRFSLTQEDKKDLQVMSMNLFRMQLKFTAGGLFTIDWTMIQNIIGATTTYLFLLLQVV